MIGSNLCIAILVCAPLAFAQENAIGSKAIDLQSVPVYLPIPTFWTHALSHGPIASGNAELDEAYKQYLDGDMLSARAHLYKARFALRGPGDDDLRLRATSLACLIDMGQIKDTLLILKTGYKSSSDQQSEDTLLVNRWKKLGGKMDDKVVPWLELFTAYQQYQRGDPENALGTWQRVLKNEQYPGDVRGLGGLGVMEVAGEVLVDAKRRSQKPQITRSDAIGISLMTKLVFPSERLFAVAQCILIEAEIEYIDGDRESAFKSLTAANQQFADYRPGWVDANLVAAIGEGRNGNTEPAEETVGAVEDALPDHHVPPEQVQALASFAKRLPAITGMDEDTRPVDLKLADARQFYRWADATGDPLLQLIAVRTLAQILREGGYWSDATFFDALQEEVGKRYRAAVPFAKRVKTAALLDYDFLVQTKFFDNHDILPGGFGTLIDSYIAGRKGTIPDLLQYLPGTTREEAEANLEKSLAPLREVGKQGDEARRKFRASVKEGDAAGTREAIIESANAELHLVSMLNIMGESIHREETTETQDTTVVHEGKQYKIHAEITSEYRVTDRKLNRLEVNQAKSCFDEAVQVLVGALEQKENIASNGAAHIISFYEQNRASIVPPDSVDVPFMLSGGSSPFDCALPDDSEKRQKSIAAAEGAFKARHRENQVSQALASGGFDTNELNKSPSSPSASEHDALDFFEKNFTKIDANSREDTPVVTTGKEGDLPLITIKQSYMESYNMSDGSEYNVAPKPAVGIDVEGRAEAARIAWQQVGDSAASPRLDEFLTILYRRGFSEGMIGQFMGRTPEQLASRNSVFSSILNAAQMALSLQRSGDFLMLPGRADFHGAQAVLLKNDGLRRFLVATAQVNPDASDYSQQIQDLTEQFPDIMSAFEAQFADSDADIRVNSPVRAIGDMADLALSTRFRPFLFLLLDDKASADKIAGTIRSAPGTKKPDQLTGLVLYDIAIGDYADAVTQLNALPADVGTRDPLTSYQLDYALGMCYRRIGDRAAEIKALSASIDELNRLRRTLTTRNEAAQFQPMRQMVYEELLGALFAQKQFAQMSAAIRTYKRSSQIPVSGLERSRGLDPQITKMLDGTAFAFDVLSRDEVWKTEDLTGLLPPEFVAGDQSKQVNPREAVLSAMNHMTDVLIDQLRGAQSDTAGRASATIRPEGLTISYFVGRNGLYRVDEMGNGNVTARFVPVSDGDLSNLTTLFRSAIEEHGNSAEAGAKLYENLLGDLNNLPAIKHLNIAPDGVLNLVPFQALKSGPNAPYLIQQYSVTYMTGAMAESGTSSEGLRALLVGNPDSTLPAAEDEVNAIARIKDFESHEPLLDAAATLARIKEQLPPVSLVHFATHARANELYPNFAFLQLAQGERMYSYDLGGMTFAGKQVFLSACETRKGSILPGDDVYGIADAFLASGASSVVATLWRIESDSSALFALRYYHFLAVTHDPSEAVAQAAREFIDGSQKINRNGSATALDNPIFWAGFSHLVPQAESLSR